MQLYILKPCNYIFSFTGGNSSKYANSLSCVHLNLFYLLRQSLEIVYETSYVTHFEDLGIYSFLLLIEEPNHLNGEVCR